MQALHRIVTARITRNRSRQPGNVANGLMVHQHAQRVDTGLIVSEAIQVSPHGQGYNFSPGSHSEGRRVMDTVHVAGYRMLLQLWYVGRVSITSFQGGELPIAPSALAAGTQLCVVEDGVGHMLECPVRCDMGALDIATTVNEFRRATANAMRANFDDMDNHGANGYLFDQFPCTGTNRCNDTNSGLIKRRLLYRRSGCCRGAERPGIRLAPYITQRDMNCPEIVPAIPHFARWRDEIGLAYVTGLTLIVVLPCEPRRSPGYVSLALTTTS